MSHDARTVNRKRYKSSETAQNEYEMQVVSVAIHR